jgi:hypothetical protein
MYGSAGDWIGWQSAVDWPVINTLERVIYGNVHRFLL